MDLVKTTAAVVSSIIATLVIIAAFGTISGSLESVTNVEVANPLLDALNLYFLFPFEIILIAAAIIGTLTLAFRKM